MQDQFGNGLDHCRPADEIPATSAMMLGVERRKLEPVVDVSVGGWIAPRLGPFGGWAALPDHALSRLRGSTVDVLGMGMGMNCGPMVRFMPMIQALWFLFALVVALCFWV